MCDEVIGRQRARIVARGVVALALDGGGKALAELRRGVLEVPQEAAESTAQMRKVIVDQIEALADKLSRQLPASASAAREALAPDAVAGEPGGGRGYNLAALLAAGGRYAMLDEDFLLPLKRQPGAAGLRLVGSPDMATRFYASRDAALAEMSREHEYSRRGDKPALLYSKVEKLAESRAR